MKQNDIHPAVAAAKKKMTERYIISAVAVILCAVIFVLGLVFKPKEKALEAETFAKDTKIDTYVKSEISVASPMFSQDALDSNNKVIGETYYILAVDPDSNKFIIKAPKEYYESKLQSLENNLAQRLDDNMLEILDEDLKVEVYGYSREMSTKLMAQLSTNYSGYDKMIFPNILEIVEKPETEKPLNYFFITAGFIGIIALCILITAFSLTAEYGRVKKKHSENTVKVQKKTK